MVPPNEPTMREGDIKSMANQCSSPYAVPDLDREPHDSVKSVATVLVLPHC